MKRLLILLTLLVALVAVGCAGDEGDKKTPEQKAYGEIAEKAHQRTPYIPENDVEFRNYNDAQRLYDSPNTIIWCSTTWGNPSAPIITVPVTGKLTSSSTTFFSPEKWVDAYDTSVVLPNRSVDGLYHPNPPGYRYGFTPGGQYVDFFNMDTFCTTSLTKLQRKSTSIVTAVDADGARLTDQAERYLKSGDKKNAERVLESLNSEDGGGG